MTSDKLQTASLFSIIISIATVALGTTTICFDFDLDPERRAHTPDFYGYVPNSSSGRVNVVISMFMFTTCHILIRVLGVAILAAVSPAITAAILGGDLLFFLLFKLARNDFRYWVKLDGAMSWIASMFARIVEKLMVDFTVMVQLRSPQDIGGLYWIMSLVLGQVTSFVAVYLYSRMEAETSKVESISSFHLWVVIGTLEGCFVVFFAMFVGTIQTKYRVTFFSTMRGTDFRIKSFRDATTDQNKMNILKCHASYYTRIRGEVREWVMDNYETWNEEQPEWFTERVKKSIPLDMIPVL